MWLDAPLAVWDCHEWVRRLPLRGVVGCAAGRFGILTKRCAAYRSEGAVGPWGVLMVPGCALFLSNAGTCDVPMLP